MESADLHRAAAGQHARVQALQLRSQALGVGFVVQTRHAADLQLVEQPGVVSMGKVGQPFIQALAHFSGSALGESDGQNFLGLQCAISAGSLSVFHQGTHHARDQHPGLTGAGAGLHRHAALGVAGDGVKSPGCDQRAIAFVSGLGFHAATLKSRRHRPRASQYSQALPSPIAGMGAPSAMRCMSVWILSINWSRRLTMSGWG